MENRRIILERGAEGEYRRVTMEHGRGDGRLYIESAAPHWEEMKDLTGKYTLNIVRAFIGVIIPAVMFGIVLAVLVACVLFTL